MSKHVTVPVLDVIRIYESGTLPMIGVVAVLDSYTSSNPQSFIGKPVTVKSLYGHPLHTNVTVCMCKDHGKTISFFFKGLTDLDIPVGSQIEFDL